MTIELLIGCAEEVMGRTLSRTLEGDGNWGNGGRIACRATLPSNVLASVSASATDVLLLEASTDVGDFSRILSAVRHASPGTRTLMLTDTCTHDLVIESIRLGACGCLLKSSDASLYTKAIRAVHAGEIWFGRLALLQAVQSLVSTTPEMALAHEGSLTRREGEILRFIGSGLTNKEIARRLEISDMTVKTHLHHIYVKLQRSGRYKAYLSQPLPSGARRFAVKPPEAPPGALL